MPTTRSLIWDDAPIFDAAAAVVSPIVMFFLLGAVAALVRSDLEIPAAVSRGLTLYLLVAVGFKGGNLLASQDSLAPLAGVALAGVALSLCLPLLAFALLRASSRLTRVDAAAVAAHYGSVSIVTFVTATTFLDAREIAYGGHLVVVLALMESPAIVSGLFLASLGHGAGRATLLPALREATTNGSVLLLVGSLLIAWLSGARGERELGPFLLAPLHGVLALFLLDLGLVLVRRLAGIRRAGLPVLAFGLYMPLLGAGAGLAIASLLELGVGDSTLFAVLGASASYIAVPAAMRHALPEADSAVSIGLALGVTFPFNVLVGIPLYLELAKLVAR